MSNHADLLPDVDGRSGPARRFRDVASALTQDQGGYEHLSEARLQLIRRLAACAVLAEGLEGRLIAGEKINIEEHASLVSSMVRLVGKLGIDRRAKEIVPTLEQYLATIHQAPAPSTRSPSMTEQPIALTDDQLPVDDTLRELTDGA